MSLENRLISVIAFLVIVFISFSDQHDNSKRNYDKVINCDLDSIRKRGRLVAITDFNSIDYFIYKGEPMGFNYELLKSFSDNLGIDLEIIPENNLDKAFRMLNAGETDLLALRHGVSSSRKNEVLFSVPLFDTRLVLVQRKSHNWRNLDNDTLKKKLNKSLMGLAGKTIYVQAGSYHGEHLISLPGHIRDSVNVIEVPYDSEKLMKFVATGEIDFTVADENVARVNVFYWPTLDIDTPISSLQNVAWSIRKENSTLLAEELNRWLSSYKKTGSYALLYAKYFRNPRSVSIIKSDFYANNTGKVSPYDDIIRQFSSRINWDWRLLASLICQESRFDKNVESYTGAFGLMQIMPETGKHFGIDITTSPESNLKAGTSYINWLHSIFDSKIPDPGERISFILAAYNAGPGHVLDAMKLARKNGMDPLKWNGNVEVWMLKKSDPKYFRDTVVKNGYFRGVESVNFVSEVLARFELYKNIIPEEKIHPF